MRNSGLSPLGAITRGLVAGAVGTVVMDLDWYARYRRTGGESDPLAWEFSAGLDDWEKAPTPARVGKRLYEGMLQRELPATHAAAANNVVHWGYGLTWGALYGIMAGSLVKAPARYGFLFGPFVWLAGYVVLPPTGLYKPIWSYDAATLWKDFSAHLAYGLATATVFRWIH